MNEAKRGRRLHIALGSGVFLVSAANLMYEVLLTRIFSVTMWYHFAFVAISVAMFGASVGAIIIYAAPRLFRAQRAVTALTWTTLCFGASVVGMFVLYARCTTMLAQMDRLPSALAAFAITSIPFVFGGMSICLALTKIADRVAALYACDLVGAAAGCIGFVAVLHLVDAPTAVFAVAFLANLAALILAFSSARAGLVVFTLLGVIFFGTLLGVSFVAARDGHPLVRLQAVKGRPESPALFEKWNSFSRIRVEGDPNRWRPPFGWGLSPRYRAKPVQELDISIDAASGTVLTRFDGDLSKVDYLRYDVSNVAHWLRPNADVVVIGTGGGRDVLSALTFRQRRITGLEINDAILDATNGAFGGFTGHLDRRPEVTFINDEARSYLERTQGRHDIIQVTLIDTWAATAVGAFALTENALYTVEAWDLFLNRLSDRGVLSFSRWYRPEGPYELYRLVSLAMGALRRRGVANPRDHLLLVKSRSTDTGRHVDVATLLVSREPFQPADVALLEHVSSSMGFEVLLTPQRVGEPVVGRLASAASLEAVARELPTDISAPTDDRPFFFNVVRISDLLRHARDDRSVPTSAARTLVAVGAAIALLTVAGIILPLRLTAGPARRGSFWMIGFFAAIGFAFMLIEVAQMQRLSLFLGHPTYAMVVALPALLLSSGLGSYSLRRATRQKDLPSGMTRLMLLTTSVVAAGLLTPSILRSASAAPMGPRILLCVAILSLPGFLMGMAFPIGITRARGAGNLLPWLWGINGAASVCATVVAMILSTTVGISITFITGAISYGVALAAYAAAGRTRIESLPSSGAVDTVAVTQPSLAST
jgi:hypothetical protein